MNNKLKVSIITATRDCSKTIEDTIQSVIHQTYPNIEYIIIDGGSTDGTVDIIKEYQHRLAYWISEPDKGIADAWNKGIARATGDIVGIINADDFYAAEAVTTATAALVANPKYGFVFGDLTVIDSEGTKQYDLEGDPDYYRTIRKDMPSIPHPTVFVRREVYENCGAFDQGYKTSLDYEFLLRIYCCGVRGLYIPFTFATMRFGGESEVNYVRGHRETAAISVKYGYNRILAGGRYYFKVLKSVMRKALESAGGDYVVRLFRSLARKPHKYSGESE